jgi:hypothetical protein
MALSHRGRISKPQQEKKRKKKKQEKNAVIPLFCFPDSKTPEITHNRKQTTENKQPKTNKRKTKNKENNKRL